MKQAVDIKKGELNASRVVSVEVVDTKSIRKELNITQKQLSQILNTSIDTIKSWESGRRNPNGLARKVLILLSKDINLLNRFQEIS
ncbi:TPA: helix-turn-helix domain-containing protein [Vibrio parahaemolyticus]|nr:helix-turn-helix domain-containing protein [Vibrio parahaemolyticus]ELB2229727.1 helix-turn-helix domain-containing protein [Vibrio parahaemolyticus]HCG9126194.1 helix-turn-helix domain-containing protein [Vibrio parahaemolyticus]HCM0840868.1 helix-turn-helix domain-containing protein [Vibrio parahaemolyticus]HCM1082194.1 helix-turn-helix domain-containing protein [Vibrio parahaemolyticus]